VALVSSAKPEQKAFGTNVSTTLPH
jgi:hypothetical protein